MTQQDAKTKALLHFRKMRIRPPGTFHSTIAYGTALFSGWCHPFGFLAVFLSSDIPNLINHVAMLDYGISMQCQRRAGIFYWR